MFNKKILIRVLCVLGLLGMVVGWNQVVNAQQRPAGLARVIQQQPAAISPDRFKLKQGISREIQDLTCPAGLKRYFLSPRYFLPEDHVGFCGKYDENYCPQYNIYVPDPSGSLTVGECSGLWMARDWYENGRENGERAPFVLVNGDIITGGYICIEQHPDFLRPPPVNGCGPGTHLTNMGAGNSVATQNMIAFQCMADVIDQIPVPSCPQGYEVTDIGWVGGGWHYYYCGLNGYRHMWQRGDRRCSQRSDALSCGRDGSTAICCGYIERAE